MGMRDERSPRERLIVPVAAVLTLMWAAAGMAALCTGKSQVFLIATGPFGAMCGYLFARDIFRRAENGGEK